PAALAKRIAEAKTSKGGVRIKDGEYVFLVKRIICESKYTGLMFIAELEVVESLKSDDPNAAKDVEPNAPRTECSQAWALDGSGPAGDAAKSNTKQFLLALLGLPESTAPDDFVKNLGEYSGETGTPESVKARGMLVACSTRREPIKSGKSAGTMGCF